MPLNRLRKRLGWLMGELVFSAIIASGLIVLATFILNGFDLMASARFVDNFTGRLLAASPERLGGFAWGAGPGFAGLVAATLAVRAVDRRRPSLTPKLKGRRA